VTIGFNARTFLAAGLVSLAAAAAPTAASAEPASGPASGGPTVCNEAGMAFINGTLSVVDPSQDPNPPARHKTNLRALPGVGVGLVNAAAHSPALAVCAEPAPVAGSGDDDGDNGAWDGTGGAGDNI
jgi:hypothetical protein